MVELVVAAKEATDKLVKAAEDIRKTSSPRADLMDEDSSVLVSNSKSDDDDRGTKGYYFMILDQTTLEPILGPIFPHLCEAMKQVKKPKAEQEAVEDAEEEGLLFQNTVFKCEVLDCPRNKNAYTKKRYLDNHVRNKHPKKRQKLNSGTRVECADTNGDVEMMDIDENGIPRE